MVAAALLDADGRVLVAQRPQGKAGSWEFPGGKVGGAHSWSSYALCASAGYAARSSGNGEFDGGISLVVKY